MKQQTTQRSVLDSLRIGVVERSQRAAVGALRRAASGHTPEFTRRQEGRLDWSHADDDGTVIGIWNAENELLTTLRMTTVNRLDDAQRLLEYSLEGIPADVPVLVLSRAATVPHVAGLGLSALVRWAYLRTIRDSELAGVLSVAYEGGPRVRSMREAGYEFHAPFAAWDGEAATHVRPLIAWLPKVRFDRALSVVRMTVAEWLPHAEVDVDAIRRSLARQAALVDAVA